MLDWRAWMTLTKQIDVIYIFETGTTIFVILYCWLDETLPDLVQCPKLTMELKAPKYGHMYTLWTVILKSRKPKTMELNVQQDGVKHANSTYSLRDLEALRTWWNVVA
jgi:hypothetical protein